MKKQAPNPVILYGARLVSPYIMLFGLYVIAHGHYSPGGGFQGGALLAASFLLVRLAAGQTLAQRQLKEASTIPLAIIGIIIYFGVGLIPALVGEHFLDYGKIPLTDVDPVLLRFYGILVIEAAIGLAVLAVLVMIYDNMVRGEE